MPDRNGNVLTPAHLTKGLFWTQPWSLVNGCTPVSPGCAHCWLAGIAHRFPGNYPGGLTNAAGCFTGQVVPRPMHPDWPRKLRDDCVAAGAAFFLKSMGEWMWWHKGGIPFTRSKIRKIHPWPDGSNSFLVGKTTAAVSWKARNGANCHETI